MIRHYLSFAHQAAAIEETLSGWTFAECWSQEKNILLMRFIEGTRSLFLETSVDLQSGYAIVRDAAARARRNTIDFFGGALGARLRATSIDEGERIIRLHLTSGDELAIFFFGAGSGNVLRVLDRDVVESFLKYRGEYDGALTAAAEPPHRSRADVIASIRASDLPPARALMRALPELGRRLTAEALHRTFSIEPPHLASIDDTTMLRLLSTVDELYTACELDPAFLVYDLPDDSVLALTPLEHLAARAERLTQFAGIGEAVRAWRNGRHREADIESLRGTLRKKVSAEIARNDRLLERMRESQEHASRAAEYEQAGQLILAHLYDVERGATKLVVEDFSGEERTITLDARLTVTQNAERYFARARKAREGAEHAVERRTRAEERREKLKKIEVEIASAQTSTELKRIASGMRTEIRMENEPAEKGSAERFRRFVVPGGYEVFAGKSAANNDELTVRFAKPNDYWFHARGSSGSHVVLRWSDSKSKPPKEALRAAASIAAYYSGARNAKMVPVAYTQKKNVRKPRGSAVGAVYMDREEVMMAEPKLPE